MFFAQVSEVSTLLGRAGTAGYDLLDTLGSSMTNLNLSGGFTSGVMTKGNIISILAFEVANTVVKGANLMQSLSEDNIKHLKNVVLPSEGVQNLISRDMDELLRIAAADKRFIALFSLEKPVVLSNYTFKHDFFNIIIRTRTKSKYELICYIVLAEKN